MRLHATIGEHEFNVDVRIQGSRVFALLDDRKYEIDLQHPGDNRLVLIADGDVFDCRVDASVESDSAVNVTVGTRHYGIALADPKRLRSAITAGAHSGGAARIAAPMPGKVVRVLAESGSQVEAGQGIVVVEAMKMQNEMKSPRAGTVTLNVEVGATVNGGDVLAVIE
jgi:biotin carboxyl carrier protein